MSTFFRNFLVAFRLASVMTAGLCGVEVLFSFLFSSGFQWSDFALAVLTGAAAATIFAAAMGFLALFLGLDSRTTSRFSVISGVLGVLFLFLVLWLKSRFFPHGPFSLLLFSLLLLLGIHIAFGRFLYLYLSQCAPDLAEARFQALAPVTVAAAGVESFFFSRAGFSAAVLATASLGLIVFVIFGQYLLTRLIWARKNKRFRRWGRRGHYLILLSVFSAAAVGGALERNRERRPAAAPASSPPVILVTIDTLRADHLSAINPKAPPTPAFDALVKDGILFPRAISPSTWTPPAVAAILTGLSPSACGAGKLIWFGRTYDFTGPRPHAQTIAEAFQSAGYLTAAFVDNLWLSRDRGYAQGFQVFEQMGDPVRKPKFLISRGFRLLVHPFLVIPREPAARLNRRVFTWLHRRPAGPFFLWIHYIDPHLPYLSHQKYPVKTRPSCPVMPLLVAQFEAVHLRSYIFNLDEADKNFIRERYRGEVSFMDDQLGALIGELKSQGLYDSSVIALTSDHGEELWEHDGFAHGHSFHNEVIHIPLLIKRPGNLGAGAVVKSWVSVSDLAATLLSLAGISAPFPGGNLLSELESGKTAGGGGADQRWRFSENVLYGGGLGTVVTEEGVKVILHRDGSTLCYDLTMDPGESRPFSSSACPWPPLMRGPVELFHERRASDREILRSLGGDQARQKPITSEEFRAIKSLGYVP